MSMFSSLSFSHNDNNIILISRGMLTTIYFGEFSCRLTSFSLWSRGADSMLPHEWPWRKVEKCSRLGRRAQMDLMSCARKFGGYMALGSACYCPYNAPRS